METFQKRTLGVALFFQSTIIFGFSLIPRSARDVSIPF
jgi:hypothetical protein